MMADPTTVDGTARDELTGKLVLLIRESRSWNETDLMHRQLAAKVKNYVRHIRSSAFAQEHGKRPKDTIVRLQTATTPGAATLELIKRIGYELAKLEIEFDYEIEQDAFGSVSVSSSMPPTTTPPRAAPPAPPPKPTPPPPAEERPSPPAQPAAARPPEPSPTPPVTAGPAAPTQPPLEPEPPELDDSDETIGVEELPGFDPFESEAQAPKKPVQPAARPPRPPRPPRPAPKRPTDDVDESVFAEQEFGRLEVEADDLVIESGTGKKTRLSSKADSAPPMTYAEAAALEKPSIPRAVLVGFTGALTSAAIWAGLAAAVGSGVSPVAIAVGFMVGFGIRVRAHGNSAPFRIVAVILTALGSLLGASAAASGVKAVGEGAGVSGAISTFLQPPAVLDALSQTYGFLDLISVGLAFYVAYRIAASGD